jgi:CRISPR/Cas system-associated exonuclease Cas4 (RecB family)
LSTEEIKESENPKKIPAAQARQGISGFLFYYLLVFIRSPWGQDIMVKQIDYVEGKTGTEVSIDRVTTLLKGMLKLTGYIWRIKRAIRWCILKA